MNKIIYDWKNVGTYVDGEIVDINDEFAQKYVPKAQAEDCYRIECGFNAIKIPDTEDQCCWHCVPCGPYKYRISEYECRECPEGQKSVVNESSILCVKIDEVNQVPTIISRESRHWLVSQTQVDQILAEFQS